MKLKKVYLSNQAGLEALMGFAERNPTMNTDDILQRAVRKGWLELADDKETGREQDNQGLSRESSSGRGG